MGGKRVNTFFCLYLNAPILTKNTQNQNEIQSWESEIILYIFIMSQGISDLPKCESISDESKSWTKIT